MVTEAYVGSRPSTFSIAIAVSRRKIEINVVSICQALTSLGVAYLWFEPKFREALLRTGGRNASPEELQATSGLQHFPRHHLVTSGVVLLWTRL